MSQANGIYIIDRTIERIQKSPRLIRTDSATGIIQNGETEKATLTKNGSTKKII